ncbi:MAG: hypothetical protein AB7O65_01920 [Candidatus Korobacteraceae bacterium]
MFAAQQRPAPAPSRQQDQNQLWAEWFSQGRTVPSGDAAQRLQRAYQQRLRLRANQASHPSSVGLLKTQDSLAQKGSAASAVSTTSFGNTNALWLPLGPRVTASAATHTPSPENLHQDYGPVTGRITALAVDPNDPTGNTVYAGAATGGLWRSRNAADSLRAACPNSTAQCSANVIWEPLLDHQPTLAVGAVAVHPQNADWILVGTGEANNAADSYYGMGFLLSKDGGQSWNLKDFTVAGQPLHGLGITAIAFHTTDPNIVVATAAATSAGLRLGAETGGAAARGIYYSSDAGESWHKAAVQDGSSAPVGSASANAVVYNAQAGRFYADLRLHGVYSSSDGVNWTRLASQPGGSLLALSQCPTLPVSGSPSACPLYRAELAVVPGRNEMYAWIVDALSQNRGMFQTLDGGASWYQVPTSAMENCGDPLGCGTVQGIYNLALAAMPTGSTTDLYAGAVNIFRCRLSPSPAQPQSCEFVNITHAYGCDPAGSYSHVHPNQHAIAFPVQHPNILYFGNDGGVYRTLDSFAQNSGSCQNPPATPWFDNVNFSAAPYGGLGSLLRFLSISQHPTDASLLLGGTRNNGSPFTSAATASSGTWLAGNRGSAGNTAINPADPDEWFTSTPGVGGSGFSFDLRRCTLGTACSPASFQPVIGAVQTGGDASSFSPPYLLDPQAPERLVSGTCRVWRGDSDGLSSEWGSPGSPRSINFAADPAGASSSTACSSEHAMLASLAAGGPLVANHGSQVIWAGQEGNGVSGGELWVTLHAEDGPASWRRALAANTSCSGAPFNPRRYTVSDIALDPADLTGRTAYATVMGFTDYASGHIFKVVVSDTPAFASTCTDITGNLPDVPANSVVTDSATPGALFAGTDIGVFVTNNPAAGAAWEEVGPPGGPGALPNVIVSKLRIFSDAAGVKLRAATYGRGLWEASLTADFQVVLDSNTIFSFPGVQQTFSGRLFALAGYSHNVTITCEANGGGIPSQCDSVAALSPSPTGTPFTITVAHGSVQDIAFRLKATGSDGTEHLLPLTLHVGDFQISGPTPNPLNAPRGTSSQGNFSLMTSGSIHTTVTLSCGSAGGGPLPAGITCTPAPASLTLTSTGATATLTILAASNAAIGNHALRVSATYADGALVKTANWTVTVAVNPRFELQAGDSSLGTAKPGQTLTRAISAESLDGYPATTVQLSCQLSGNPGTAACEVAPPSITLASGATQTAMLSIHTTGAVAADTFVTVTGADGSLTRNTTLSYSIQDYRLIVPPLELIPGGPVRTAAVSIVPENGYTGSVALNCIPGSVFGSCSFSPPGPVTVGAGGATVNLTVTAPVNAPSGTHSLKLRSNDAALPSASRDLDVPVNIYDFQWSGSSVPSVSVNAGETATYTLAWSSGPLSFPQAVTFSCAGLPQLTSCEFSPAELQSGLSSASVQVRIRTTAVTVTALPSHQPGGILFALWLGLPVAGLVLTGLHHHPRAQRGRTCILLALLVCLFACGGGGGNDFVPPIPKPGTPSGTYAITIQGNTTGNVGAAQRSTQVTLIVR